MDGAQNIVVTPERAMELAGAELLKEKISHKITLDRLNAMAVENAKLHAELEKLKGGKKKNIPDTPPKS